MQIPSQGTHYSIIIPIYKNEDSLPEVMKQLSGIASQVYVNFKIMLEVVFVVDGSPDGSFQYLSQQMNQHPFDFQVIGLSRNFGAFSAIRAGLTVARGDYMATKAADLQEPADLYLDFLRALHEEKNDVVVAMRVGRKDPFISKMFAGAFWALYRRFIQEDLPPGGADVFGCNKSVRDHIIRLNELNTSLIGLLYWVGFKRKHVPYQRLAREKGRSSWSFKKKFNYLMDSFFAFSDLPIKLLYFAGSAGILFSIIFSVLAIWAKLTGNVEVPGYTATVLVISFFGGVNLFGMGIMGSYVWRSYENTKGRPDFIVMKHIISLAQQEK